MLLPARCGGFDNILILDRTQLENDWVLFSMLSNHRMRPTCHLIEAVKDHHRPPCWGLPLNVKEQSRIWFPELRMPNSYAHEPVK